MKVAAARAAKVVFTGGGGGLMSGLGSLGLHDTLPVVASGEAGMSCAACGEGKSSDTKGEREGRTYTTIR